MVIKFEAPPPQHEQRKAIRVTDSTHAKIKEMAGRHNTSIAKFVAAMTDAHYKNTMQKGPYDG